MTKEEVIQTLIDDYSRQAKLSKREQTIFEHGLLTGIDLNREPAWKPSIEQMEILEKVCNTVALTKNGYEILVSLYNDLKKLKGE